MDVTPLPKGGPRARRTKTRRDRAEVADALPVLRRRSGYRCEAHVPDVCNGLDMVAHHKLRRAQGGGNDHRNLLFVCSACHEWIHANPAVSYQLGFLIPRGAA